MARELVSVDDTTRALPAAVVAANQGTASGTFAAGNDARITGAVQASGTPTMQTIKTDGDGRPGVWEYIHDDSDGGYIWHLMCGANMSGGGALIGLGIDNGGTGLFVNNKLTGVGIKIVQNETITSATAYGLQIVHESDTAPAEQVTKQAIAGACEALQWISESGASGPFLKVLTGAGERGSVRADTGNIHWLSDIVTHDGGIFRARANELTTDANQVQVESGQVEFVTYTGSSGQFWHKRISHSAQSIKVELADTTPGGSGPDYVPTWYVAIEAKQTAGSAAGTQLGFFGASPVAKPTGVAVDAAGIHAALVSLGLIGA